MFTSAKCHCGKKYDDHIEGRTKVCSDLCWYELVRVRQALGGRFYTWKSLSDGELNQEMIAYDKDTLFEICGFGAVRTDEQVRGALAVEVKFDFESDKWIQA